MAEENFERPEMGSLHDTENLDNMNSVQDNDNMNGKDNVHDVNHVHNAGHVHDTNDVHNKDNIHDSNTIPAVNSAPEEIHLSEEVKVTPTDTEAGEEKRWPGWPGENVFRMLVPIQKVGSIIGRRGEYIKKTCEETKARIKVLDGPPGTAERAVLALVRKQMKVVYSRRTKIATAVIGIEHYKCCKVLTIENCLDSLSVPRSSALCVVMISAKEEPSLLIPPAMAGLLKVHKQIVDVDIDSDNAPPGAGSSVTTRLLVAASQAGNLIGKQGSTIKSIQDTSQCTIRVVGQDHLPLFGLPDDSVVEIQGEPAGVHKAVEMVASHLRKFLLDRSVIGLFEMHMQMPNVRSNQNMPPAGPTQSWARSPSSFPGNAGGGPGFGPSTQYMPPAGQFDNYFPPVDMPPLGKKPRHAPPHNSRDASMGTYDTNVLTQQSVVTKVTQNMQIALSYADAVIGTSGSNISYIRRASGASISIQETRGVPGEMTVEITGSASQVQTAQQLIQMWDSNCHPIRVIWHGWRNEGLGGLDVMNFYFWLYRSRELERRWWLVPCRWWGDQFKRCDHKGKMLYLTWGQGAIPKAWDINPSINSIADAASSVQNIAAGPPSQGYNPYSQGPVYTSSGGTDYPSTADYGSIYGSSYGY